MTKKKPPTLADVVNGTPEFMDGFNVLKSTLTQMRRLKKALEKEIRYLAALPTEQRQDIFYHDEDGTPIDGTFIMDATAAAIVKCKEFIDRHTELVWAFDAEIARQLEMNSTITNGPQKRGDVQDKQDFMGIVRDVHTRHTTIQSIIDAPELTAYRNKYHGRDTLRGWVKEAIPDRNFGGNRKK